MIGKQYTTLSLSKQQDPSYSILRISITHPQFTDVKGLRLAMLWAMWERGNNYQLELRIYQAIDAANEATQAAVLTKG